MRELFSTTAEESFIGALLIDPTKYHDVSDITPDMFASEQCKSVYQAIRTTIDASKAVDVITIADHISAQSPDALDRIGGLDYIVSLNRNTPSANNITAYAQVIQDKFKERNLYQAAVKIQSILMEDGLTTEERYQEAEAVFTALSVEAKHTSEAMDMPEALKDFIGFLEWRFENPGIHGVKTGLTAMDERLQGLKPGEMYILAARPAMGKTTLALNIALNAAKNHSKIYISSLEMPRRQLIQRLVAAQGHIRLAALKDASQLNQDEWGRITISIDALRKTNMRIDDQGGLDVNELRSRCRRMKRRTGLDLIVVDYLQLLEDRTASNRFDVVSSVSRKLKSLAKELDCSVLALSQLSRKCEERADKRPILSDLRESGQIEQDADVIQFIYRDEVYNDDSYSKGIAEIITAKYRDGEIGTDYLAFLGSQNRFDNLASDYQQPEPVSTVNRSRGFAL